MLSGSTLAVFLLAATALALTPGPDMLFCLGTGLSRGRLAGMVGAGGVACGLVCHITAASLGLAGLIAASPAAFDAVRYAGAAYLAWIGFNTLRHSPFAADAGAAAPGGLRRVFVRGFATNILNPKVVLFFIAFLPQFVDPSRGSMAAQMAVLGVLFAAIGMVVNVGVAIAAGWVGRLFARRPLLARIQQWVAGSVFLGLAARLALAGGRSA